MRILAPFFGNQFVTAKKKLEKKLKMIRGGKGKRRAMWKFKMGEGWEGKNGSRWKSSDGHKMKLIIWGDFSILESKQPH